MPGKVTKLFAHLSVLIDLILSPHHNHKIREIGDSVAENAV